MVHSSTQPSRFLKGKIKGMEEASSQGWGGEKRPGEFRDGENRIKQNATSLKSPHISPQKRGCVQKCAAVIVVPGARPGLQRGVAAIYRDKRSKEESGHALCSHAS